VGGVHALADTAEDLEAGDIGVEALAARASLLLRKRKDGGGEDGGGVRLGGIEIVVEVERMGGRAVDERGPRRGELGPEADCSGGAGAPGADGFEDAGSDRVGGAGDRDGDDVDELAVGGFERFGGPGVGRGQRP
jgi:hypothetical protein